MTKLVQLDELIKAVCPIDGISIKDWADKSTWRLDVKKEATPEQVERAKAVIMSFDPNAVVEKPISRNLPIEDQLEIIKQALIDANLLTPEQFQKR